MQVGGSTAQLAPFVNPVLHAVVWGIAQVCLAGGLIPWFADLVIRCAVVVGRSRVYTTNGSLSPALCKHCMKWHTISSLLLV
jgi:hypothetical protein